MRGIRATRAVIVLLAGVTAASCARQRSPAPTAGVAPGPGPTTSTTTIPATTTTTTLPHPPPGLIWQPLGDALGGRPALQAALPAGPTELVVWIDKTLVIAQLIPGTKLPGGAGWNPVAAIPPAVSPLLLAAFNGGFMFADSRGGFYAQDRAAYPLVAGAASLVFRNDGTATVGLWGRDLNLDPTVVAVRQNLVLLVDGGAPTPDVGRPYPFWGYSPTHSSVVWRSAVGVDAGGNLVYVGGANITPPALADLLVKAGCLRAMELDINHRFVTFNTYGQTSAGAVHGTKGLPGMAYPGDRYLTPDQRDFVALYWR
jgi:Phosphodiester glycosidase